MGMECVVCKTFCQTSCASCKLVHYCSMEHQKQDWKKHKWDCVAFKIIDDPENQLGKQWVATRNLKTGQILFDESPLLISPQFPTQDPYCVTCGFHFKELIKQPELCSLCKWPVCGSACEANPMHSKNECPFFVTHNINCSDLHSFPIGKSLLLTMVRGVGLRDENIKAFRQLIHLQHLSKDEVFLEHQSLLLTMFHVALKNMKSQLPSHHNYLLYKIIIKVALLNSFGKQFKGSSGESAAGSLPIDYMLDGVDPLETTLSKRNIFIYNKSSRLNHSCYPNCSWTIGPEPTYKIRIRAAVPVKQGEALTISYGNNSYGYGYNLSFLGTIERHQLLRAISGIDCRCVRCVDPAELGNFSSAIICHDCVESCHKNEDFDYTHYGYHIPQNPFDRRNDAPWKCHRCDHEFILYEVQEIESHVREHLKPLIESSDDPLEAFLKGMNDHCLEDVHPGHWAIGEATELISSILRREIADISEGKVSLSDIPGSGSGSDTVPLTVLERHIEWARHGLNLSNNICPGINQYRAKQLLWFSCLLRLKLLSRSSSSPSPTTGSGSGSDSESYTALEDHFQLHSDYDLFIRSSEEALKFFKDDFCRPGERKNYIATGIQKAIRKVKNALAPLLDLDLNVEDSETDTIPMASLELSSNSNSS